MSRSNFDYWRERAREARGQASLLDPGAASAMLDLARAYDRMAARIRPKGPRLGRPSQSGEPVPMNAVRRRRGQRDADDAGR
jgi:hypothetical protein